MIREETIKWLELLKAEIGKLEHRTLWHYAEAIDMAIKALSIEPKTKCIAQIRIDQGDMEDLVNEIVDKMSESKTGHWISDNLVGWKCSECGRHIVLNIEVGNYCPNCGAKMRGLEE